MFPAHERLSNVSTPQNKERLPPAQPAYVLRGHAAEVHALHFTRDNTRLLTADADGWVISWNVAFKRPVAVWKAHDTAVMGLGSWCQDRVITYVCFCDFYGSETQALTTALTAGMAEITNFLCGSWVLQTKMSWRRRYPSTVLPKPRYQRIHGFCIR